MKKTIFILLFALIGVAQGAWATETEYISQVMIAIGKSNRDKLVNEEGWKAIDKDLNAGAGGAYVYLLYKTTTIKANAISDFYLKTGSSPEVLVRNGHTYHPVSGLGGTNLNYGNDGDKIYLFCTWGLFDDYRAVTDISFNSTASGAVARDDTGAACDLNRGAGGEYIYMHVTFPQVDDFPYVERSWDDTNKKVIEETKTKSISDGLTRLDGSNYELNNGWYVVDNNVTYNQIIEIKGDDVNIIVADGMKLNASEGIRIWKDKKLRIFGQRVGTGLVYAHANAGPGIGGRENIYAGRLEIHGGTIDAQSGSKNNAGIGSGSGSDAGYQSITIYGGDVKAKGGSGGAGIGSGKGNTQNPPNHKNVGPIYIYGGTVYANGGANGAGIGGGTSDAGLGYITDEHSGNGDIYIYGGNVYATGGENGPGIGSGNNGHLFGTISIYGANVIATGNKNADGIGGAGSQLTINNKVTIENSTVKAIGKSDKSGIKCYMLNIQNSVVEAKSDKTYYKFIRVTSGGYDEYNFPFMTNLMRDYMGDGLMLLYGYSEPDAKWDKNYVWRSTYPQSAAERARCVKIMPCDHQDATYTPNNDGTHTVHCKYCKIGAVPHDSYVYSADGYYCATCHAGKPDAVKTAEVVLYIYKFNQYSNEWEWQATNYTVAKNGDFTLPTRDGIEGYDFVGWVVIPSNPSGNVIEPAIGETVLPANHQLKIDTNIKLAARYRPTGITLADNTSNETVLSENYASTRAVTLADRTLWKDDSWNTLCLPFSLTAEKLADSRLSGYTGLKELDVEGYYDVDGNRYDEAGEGLRQTGFDAATGTLYLYFLDATSIEAGKPYIIKWATAEPNYFENPVFNSVTISSIAPTSNTSADGMVTFTGTYAPVEIGSTGDNTLFFLGANNNLYYPNAEMTIGCQRAYFILNDGLIAGDPASGINTFVLNFGDDTTGIVDAIVDTDFKSASQESGISNPLQQGWFTLDGRRLNGKPSHAGVYINNGIKVVIK